MNLMCNKNWHFNTVGEKTTYSTNGATSPLDEGRWSGEEPNLISYTIKNVRWISDLMQSHNHMVEMFI